MVGNWQARLVVTFVWGIIISQAILYFSLYVPMLYQNNFPVFIIYIPLFIFAYCLLCISYYKSVYYPPGHPNYHVNLHYNQQLEEIKQRARKETDLKKMWRLNRIKGQSNLQQIKLLNEVSYCFKCDLVKQPRVHHCRICKRCIQRMDHHCPWVGNCVGRLNHKYFILFLFYASSLLFLAAFTISIDWLNGQIYASQFSKGQYYAYYYCCITCYMLSASIGFLFVTQMITSCQNITTLQSFTQGITKHNVFDTGSYLGNLREVFGTGNWLLPTNPFPPQCPLQNGSIDVL